MPASTGSYNDVSDLVVEVMKIFGIEAAIRKGVCLGNII